MTEEQRIDLIQELDDINTSWQEYQSNFKKIETQIKIKRAELDELYRKRHDFKYTMKKQKARMDYLVWVLKI